MWGRMAKTALDGLESGEGNAEFLQAKLVTARYFIARQMPGTALRLARIRTGADPVMALDAEMF